MGAAGTPGATGCSRTGSPTCARCRRRHAVGQVVDAQRRADLARVGVALQRLVEPADQIARAEIGRHDVGVGQHVGRIQHLVHALLPQHVGAVVLRRAHATPAGFNVVVLQQRR